jgi:hypothetical protein
MTSVHTKVIAIARIGAPGIKINHRRTFRVEKMMPSQY